LSAVLAHILESASLEAAHDLHTVGCWQPWLHYSEETITERFLLRLMQNQWWWSSDLKIQVISIAHVKTGSKAISEPKTGADWEWHFGTPDNNRWFSLRVQAKKAREESGWGFTTLKESVPVGTSVRSMCLSKTLTRAIGPSMFSMTADFSPNPLRWRPAVHARGIQAASER
jgi:hypothetical protein